MRRFKLQGDPCTGTMSQKFMSDKKQRWSGGVERIVVLSCTACTSVVDFFVFTTSPYSAICSSVANQNLRSSTTWLTQPHMGIRLILIWYSTKGLSSERFRVVSVFFIPKQTRHLLFVYLPSRSQGLPIK